jgi:hypothetical protein
MINLSRVEGGGLEMSKNSRSEVVHSIFSRKHIKSISI